MQWPGRRTCRCRPNRRTSPLGRLRESRAEPNAELANATSPRVSDCLRSGEDRRRAQLGLDAQQPVVFGHTLGARRSAALELADAGCDGKIGNRRVLGLAAAM